MKIKEEGPVLDIGLLKEEKSPVSYPVLKIQSETAVHSDSEPADRLKIKEEERSISDLTLKIKSETTNRTKVKDIDLKYEENIPFSDTLKIKNNSNTYGMVSKIEIKEEPWWQERTSTEVKLLQEALSVSELKNEANEGSPETESARLHTEATPVTYSAAPYFSNADLEEKDSFKLNKYSNNKLHVSETCREKSSQYTLEADTTNHGGKRSFRCDVCEKNFTRKGHLKMHILIHQNNRPFKCDDCEKSFTEQRHLKRHIIVHQGKRPFKCEFCGKSFTEKGHLKTHIVIHQGKRPFKCDDCEKSFRQKGDLNRHILIHQGKRPHRCDVCGNSFTLKGNLNKHILIHQDKRSI